MRFIFFLLLISTLFLFGQHAPAQSSLDESSVIPVGAMKNVMWKGELDGIISFDTMNLQNVYGVGPLAGLRGEILILDGDVYVSEVEEENTASVQIKTEVSAPFFVYARVKNWKSAALPDSIRTIGDLERYLDKKTKDIPRPFIFRLTGNIKNAHYHIQDLPPGTSVSSPKEAHQGQRHFQFGPGEADILGFFSTEHQGVFTHHDSFLHLHILSADGEHMGHVDKMELGTMELSLPVEE
jgi:acetolactate decarboxylase